MVAKRNNALSIVLIILCSIETISLIHVYIIMLMNPDDVEIPGIISIVVGGLAILVSMANAIKALKSREEIKYRQKLLLTLLTQFLVVASALLIDVFRYEINALIFAIHTLVLPFLLCATLNNLDTLDISIKKNKRLKQQTRISGESYWEPYDI